MAIEAITAKANAAAASAVPHQAIQACMSKVTC
jgi:hypothetical protein